MKKIDLGQLISIFANIGVIAGIVFLGMELAQNNRLMEAEARRARTYSIEASWGMLAENEEIARLIVKDRGGEGLDDVEYVRLMAYWIRMLTDLQLAYLELPEEELQPTLSRYRRNFAIFPALATVWEEQRYGFRNDFVEWMEENVVSEHHE